MDTDSISSVSSSHSTKTRQYNRVDPVIAGALLDAGINQNTIAEKLGVDTSTICKFNQRYRENNKLKDQVKEFSDNIPLVLLENIAEETALKNRILKYYNRLDENAFNSISDAQKGQLIGQTTTAAGVDIDKFRLLSNQSTVNVDYHVAFERAAQQRSDLEQVRKALQELGINVSDSPADFQQAQGNDPDNGSSG